MTNNKLQKFSDISFMVTGVIILLSSYIFKYISNKLPGINDFTSSMIFHIIIHGSLFCIVASFIDKLKKFAIIVICFEVGIIGAYPQLGVSIIYIIPTLLSFYIMDGPYVKKIITLNSIVMILSKMYSTYITFLVSDIIGAEKNLVQSIIGIIIVSIIEIILIIGCGYLFFKFIFFQNSILIKELSIKSKAADDILQFCSLATSYHNKYLYWHINGVKEISRILVDGLIEHGVDIDKNYKDQILFSVQFHDIGKIYIDSSILDKPGKLTDIEFNLIKEHPIRGYDLFSLIPKNCINEEWDKVCKNIIIQHHERLDGSGYPFGLSSDNISLESKIVAVADVVDALLSWRPYKNPMSWEKMCSILNDSRDKLDNLCIDIIIEHKEELLDISDKNNLKLKNLFKLEDNDLYRK